MMPSAKYKTPEKFSWGHTKDLTNLWYTKDWRSPMAVIQHTRHPYITQRTLVQGGEPTIRGTRISVRTVVQYVLRQGIPPEVLAKEFSPLSLAAVYDAISFYYDHRPLIDRLLQQQTEAVWRR